MTFSLFQPDRRVNARVRDPGISVDMAMWRAWFASAPGRALETDARRVLRDSLAGLYGASALQVGRPGSAHWLDDAEMPLRIVLEDVPDRGGALAMHPVRGGGIPPPHRAKPCVPLPPLVIGAPESLPCAERSVDLVLLPFTLDCAADPHAVLREAERVLRPEGHIVVVGFNPMSLWGLRRLVAMSRRNAARRAPWSGHFLGVRRVRDWLRLLGFETSRGSMFFYRPPMSHDVWLERLQFLESAGDRWWPMAAGAWCLVGKKRVRGVTPLVVPWLKTRRIIPGVQPVSRSCSRAA